MPGIDGGLDVRLRVAPRGHAPTFALDVELTVPPGITILFGPSGAGKSTTLQAIAGLIRPDGGRVALGSEVWFDGDRGIDVPAERRRIAYVFQSLALFPHMSALGNVAYGVDRALPRGERLERARRGLERLGVGHLAHRRPRTFSGGEAQRVALARALATSPRVILLDEPFSSLDRGLRVQLGMLVRELVDELKVPLLQVTHLHGEARALGDRGVRIEDGRIVARGDVATILGE